MSSSKKGPSSSFAAAAKVLFDSAQKTGAVKPLDSSTKLYAHQLKKIQNQSKKRGGSLGGVSYKVAEFLATQRPPPQELPRRNTKSIATKVPLLDIPFAESKESPKQTEKLAPKATLVSPSLTLEIPEIPSPSPDLTEAHHPVADGDKEAPTSTHTKSSASFFPEVLITEDKPSFELRSPQVVPPVQTANVIAKPSIVKPVIAPPAAPPVSPSIVVPLSVPKMSEEDTVQSHEDTAVESFSVDSWEKQREQEMERLQLRQAEIEERRLALLREEEHRTLGEEWVKQRSWVTMEASAAATSEESVLLSEISLAQSPEVAIDKLRLLLDLGSRSTHSVIASAAARVSVLILPLAPIQRREMTDKLMEVLEKKKVSADIRTKIALRLATDGETIIETYRSLTPEVQQSLERPALRRLVSVFTRFGHWEEAIAMIEKHRQSDTDRNGSLELALANSSIGLDAEIKNAVSTYVTKSLSATGRLSLYAKLALARLEVGAQRRNLLLQLAASQDVDERIYAELIKRSSTADIPGLVNELQNRGLNKNDPLILEALAFRSISEDDPMQCFHEIEKQSHTIGFRPAHLMTALTAARLFPTQDVLSAAVSVAKELPMSQTFQVLKMLIPSLFSNGMHQEVVDLVDLYASRIDITKDLPAAVGLVNDSLRAVGRTPLSELTAKDATLVIPVSGRKKDSPTPTVEQDLSALTDTMLSHAKEKQWETALEVLKTLSSTTPTTDTNAPTITLLYNCALSAAVDRPETVLTVFDMMKENNIPINSTTVNTVLSSLSKSELWTEALPFFEKSAIGSRDSNTYLVMLSLLGRHNMWEEASSVFSGMRKTISKPSATMFSLAIGATANHNWSVTLSMFQDMLKIHGANVKDTVTSQVLRSLEQNGRTAEVGKLKKELEKKKKKKK